MNYLSTAFRPLSPSLPTEGPGGILWQNVPGCTDTIALAQAIQQDRRFYLIVTLDTQSATRLEHEIRFFLNESLPVLHFPDWEILPYDTFSPLTELVSERIKTLAQLSRALRGVLITPITTLMQRIGPRTHILGSTFDIALGNVFHIEEMRSRLEGVGYRCVSQVFQHGEFAVRGSIFDLFPMGSLVPYRIELFDQEVESIRTFDVENQRSLEKIEKIYLFPAREFPFDAQAIKRFRRSFRTHFPDAPPNHPLCQDLTKGVLPGGVEYYFPLFVEKTETLFDYLPFHTVVVTHNDVNTAGKTFFSETYHRYEQRQSYVDRPPLPPEQLFLSPDVLIERFEKYPRIHITTDEESSEFYSEKEYRPLPHLAIHRKQASSGEKLTSFISDITQMEGRVLFIAETAGRREMLLETLGRYAIFPKLVESWSDFLSEQGGLCLTVAPLDHGVWLTHPPLALITETQLFGEKVQQRRRRRVSSTRVLDHILKNLEELEIGAPVVHQDHGIGRYRGLTKLRTGGIETEFLTLEYANQDILYVPVSSLHLIGRYSGADPHAAPLHKLGGEQWQKSKRKALERIRDVAAELLDVYAKRVVQEGAIHPLPTEYYNAFAEEFPFEETPDQESAILDVIRDMSARKPMDRVICGDVGFGKTEVAMRAAFIAVQNGKQVAVLVPTTLLAQQHFQNFCDRYADWPFRVEVLSRFTSKKEMTSCLNNISEGRADIVIGTHKLLQKDVTFKNLGLVIIDEEHRFGVTQKEYFKQLRSEVDCLSLTATPIPRTLNLAMSGLRDISIIATPPLNRHAIKTFITEWDTPLIQEAILREIKRGGQVYFLHNKIETMEKMAQELGALVPVARIRIAHGQMPERELESLMLDFYHQRFNVLICTTIIESGIDVPSANTLLVHRADLLGLAQLHQIRGRVGRSHHRAYAYMIVPAKSLMTPDAIKRLEALEASEELGAGFMLSSHDLEIRGAGELLGDEQSGQIQEIGLAMYTELLDRAVQAIRSGQLPELDMLSQENRPEIDLQAPALIPDTAVPDVHTRLVLYKRIANAKSEEELYQLQVEWIDRFGLSPQPVKTLFGVASIKLKAEVLGICKIEVGSYSGRIVFHTKPSVNPKKVIELIQKYPELYRLEGPDTLRFSAQFEGPEMKIIFLEKLIDLLTK